MKKINISSCCLDTFSLDSVLIKQKCQAHGPKKLLIRKRLVGNLDIWTKHDGNQSSDSSAMEPCNCDHYLFPFKEIELSKDTLTCGREEQGLDPQRTTTGQENEVWGQK